ncbi:GSCOCG00011836001-RA-CDS, partial [Cotesia congregata]
SLAPNISKVYEVIINDSIVDYCNENKIIPDNQFGFRHQYSIVHAIHKLLTDV